MEQDNPAQTRVPSLDLKYGMNAMGLYVPRRLFFTKGVGVHKDQLSAFELALRDAGIERFNLVSVSSIYPRNCKIIPRSVGIKELSSGTVVFCVMARIESNEPFRQMAAAVGLAVPRDLDRYGYLSEHHAFGQTQKVAGEYAEDLAATMLATTLGIEFDPDEAYDKRKEVYHMSGNIVTTKQICQAAKGDRLRRWTHCVATGVFLP